MRYETGVSIGRGASAEVFKAWDPVAERTVALKLFPPGGVVESGGDAAARRDREARAQASLDHPSICQIYEVGVTAGGRHFIAMQYVEGEPLDVACAGLPIHKRVSLVLQIAEAVAVAHAAGLVHRDLKPSNLLVETDDTGARRAFVLDFGIVHVADASRLTATGHVLGTPGYLSPEQARGAHDLDARSDVFALGVNLYQVLTGRLPFEASSDVGAILRVLDHEPPLAHVVDAAVAPALSHVAQKAMEKDPRRRYRDAAAFARDLGRCLDGGSTEARRISWVGRWMRRVERHPRRSAAAFAALILLVFALAWGVRERVRGEAQARDAEIFARRATEIEARARYALLLPRHSIVESQARLRSELVSLAEDAEDALGRAAAAGDYAVGRAALALGRNEQALTHLARAREAGFEDPAWAVDWSRALLEDTRNRLREVELLRDPDARRAFRACVLDALRTELPSNPRPELADGDALLIRALHAFLDGDVDDAREAAEAVIAREPWRIEADLLLADLHRETASVAFLGDDASATLTSLEEERAGLVTALDRAPSAPALHRRLAENRLTAARAAQAVGAGGLEWSSRFDEARAALEAGLTVDAEDRVLRNLAVEVGWRHILARLRADGPEGLAGTAQETVDAGQTLTTRWSDDAAAHRNLGNAQYAQAEVLRAEGRSQSALYEASAQSLAESLARAPGSAIGWQSLGIAWIRHGSSRTAAGEDPRDSLRLAVDAFEQSYGGVRSHESRVANSVCVAWSDYAYYGVTHQTASGPNGSSADEIEKALDDADAACARALDAAPDYRSALSNRTVVAWTRVAWRIAAGLDPSPAYARARSDFEALLNVAPDHVNGRINLAGMVADMAAWRLDAGGISEPATLAALGDEIDSARARVLPLRERFAFDVDVNVARLDTATAAIRCRGGVDARTAFAEAEKSITRLDNTTDYASLRARLRAVYQRRYAGCLADSGAAVAAQAAIDAGLAAVDEALRFDLSSSEATREKQRIEALLHALRAGPS